MTTETIYYAFDDTEFHDMQECQQYEQEFFSCLDGASMYNEDMRPITISAENYGLAAEAYYIFIINASKAKTLFSRLEYLVGTAQPKCEFGDANILVYDESGGWDNAWINLTRRMAEDAETVSRIRLHLWEASCEKKD